MTSDPSTAPAPAAAAAARLGSLLAGIRCDLQECLDSAKSLADDAGVPFSLSADRIATAMLYLRDADLPHDAARLRAGYLRCRCLAEKQMRALLDLGADQPPKGLTEVQYRDWFTETFGPLPASTLDDLRVMLAGEAAQLLRHVEELIVTVGAMLAAGEEQTPPPARKKGVTQAWTQAKLNAAIREDITTHAELLEAARARGKGARKDIQKVFGRNAVADRLGVARGSRNMVSRSEPWREIAEEFGLQRKQKRPAKPTKVGLVVAEEKAAEAAGDTTEAEVLRRETRGMIDDAIARAPKKDRPALKELLDRFDRGEADDDTTRKTLELYHEQAKEDLATQVLKG